MTAVVLWTTKTFENIFQILCLSCNLAFKSGPYPDYQIYLRIAIFPNYPVGNPADYQKFWSISTPEYLGERTLKKFVKQKTKVYFYASLKKMCG